MLSSVGFCLCFCAATIFALPQPGQAAPAATPTLPAIVYNIPGVINNTLIPILGKGSDGGIEVGGIGSHDTPGDVIHEHGNGDAQVGPDGVEVCLTQTFVIGPISVAYGVGVGGSNACGQPIPTSTK